MSGATTEGQDKIKQRLTLFAAALVLTFLVVLVLGFVL
jgi:hypothetical protein